ncbi:hypothetical protein MVLG_02265 [Microbotryum lychnidis-dioicae p1A1 Lamole]|uniref:Major facilitator superfamily (MFS) profile domain-containing protein n=1 Tax=Microbotryum lychnidis-dioicae (strain p1A1 Lamole / MvSl-1064) TaxID=683840 RepID=U5H4M7_USTV1|nr:hypothetical protein MVLG_02265 [Microbotryum lychnidis-dioicae p1A1 Lamole]|eukprot:KDE07398.1 hypothetical protein MVLG_02265 [Microbotryum lychnidis-dioicae p1A1 Lamole]
MPNWLYTFGYRSADGVGCALQAKYQGGIYCISSLDRALITSLLSLGTLVGALSGGVVADDCGRRGGILFSLLLFLAGASMQVFFTNIVGLIVGRVVAGLGVGSVSMLVPMYQAEAAPPQLRGAIVSCYQLSITLGIFGSQVISSATRSIESTASWRIPIGAQILWGLLLMGGTFVLPESPRHLINQGKLTQGRRSLATMRGRPENSEIVNAEYKEIFASIEAERVIDQGSLLDCFRSKIMLKRTLCGVFAGAFQQLTGVNFIWYYSTQFFTQVGISEPYLASVALSIVNVCMTAPGIMLVERLGRRKLLLNGALWMSTCQLIIGAVSIGVDEGSSAANSILLAFTTFFVAGFASTWGCGTWVLISELYPLRLRGKAMSLATASHWLWSWAVAFSVPYLTDPNELAMGSRIAFVWFVTTFMGAIWTFFCVPETSGWSLEELDGMFASGTPYRLTPHWKPSTDSRALVDASFVVPHSENYFLEQTNSSYTTV